nr:flagellin [Dubosiella newyorkensis]
MSMIVKHNLTAMNSNRMLAVNTSTQAKSTEKLSSGYKINRAADDAAGLSISEKMRRQIKGLTQASSNAQDGISCVQTAEGALNEVHDMLQRLNQLAVKGETGTLTSVDRNYIKAEINQLMSEIDRVQSTTTFNEQSLLDGSFTGKGLQVGAEAGQHIDISIKSMSLSGLAAVAGNANVSYTTWTAGTGAAKMTSSTQKMTSAIATAVIAKFHNTLTSGTGIPSSKDFTSLTALLVITYRNKSECSCSVCGKQESVRPVVGTISMPASFAR